MKIKLLPLIFCFFVLSVYGQETEARKFDEFGSVNCEEYLARMDMAAIELANNPDAQIYFLIYEGKEQRVNYNSGKFTGYKLVLPPRNLANVKIASMRRYLKTGKYRAERFIFVNGGYRENFTIEVWLVPLGAEAPKPAPTLKKMKYRKGKAKGFCLGCC